MTTTNASSGTNIQEIADGIYRINTGVATIPGGFSFNQYLVLDDQPLLFHTGPRKLFPLVREAVGKRDTGQPAALHRVFAFRGGRMRRAQ